MGILLLLLELGTIQVLHLARALAITTALTLVVSSCSDAASSPPETSVQTQQSPAEPLSEDQVADLFEREMLAYVECYQEHGVDAEIVGGNELRTDQKGTLTREETMSLLETCQEEVREAGLVAFPDPRSEAAILARHGQFERMRACLTDLGHDLPEMVSQQAALEDPAMLRNPFEDLDPLEVDIEEAVTRCGE